MKKKHGQMSEAFLTAALLSASGGLQDAYTYIARGQVFANAQTGNIVLLSQNLFSGNWGRVLHYLFPLPREFDGSFRRSVPFTGVSWYCWWKFFCCWQWV